jgi:hypothetical protein
MPVHKPIDSALQMPLMVVHEVNVLNVVNDAPLPTVPGLVNAMPCFGFTFKDRVSGLFETRQGLPTLTTNADR